MNVSYSRMIWSRSFTEPVPLDCELHIDFFFFGFPPPLYGTRWLKWAGIEYFPSPGYLGSDNIPVG